MARIELRDCTVRIKDGLGAHPDIYPCTAHADKSRHARVRQWPRRHELQGHERRASPRRSADTPKRFPSALASLSTARRPHTVHVVTARSQGPVSGVNAKQSVTIDPNTASGHLHLTFKGKTTDVIAYNADDAAVKAALVALDDGYSASDFDVTGGPGPTAWVVEFKGALGAAPQALLTGDGSALTGGATTVTVETTQAGRPAAGTNTTVDITFSPALGAGTYAVDATITFLSQQLEVKIGEGNITYTEKSDYTYLLDRDNLDTVKEGKEVPLDVKWDSVYEFITTGTSEEITPMDALKGIGAAAEWITYAKDPCEPYAVAIEVEQVAPAQPPKVKSRSSPTSARSSAR